MSQFFTSGGPIREFQLQHKSSNEYSALISFRIEWFDLLAVQGTLRSPPAPQFENTNSPALCHLYGPTLRSLHDYWKNHSFDYTGLCRQSDVYTF